jgi:hypothetical protein
MTRRQIIALDKSLYNMRSRLVGRTWTAKQFITRFNRYFPYIANVDVSSLQSRMKLVAAYTDLNKILRKRGLAIKSSNYYQSFCVVEDAGKKVQSQRAKVQRITASANDLNQGLFAFGGQYTARLTDAEIESFVDESAFYPGRISY